MKPSRSPRLRLLSVLLLPLLLLGCERDTVNMNETADYMRDDGLTLDPKSGTVSTNRAERAALTLSPEAASVGEVGDTIVFVAEGGAPPYQWSVGFKSNGTIRVENGDYCIYTAVQLKKNSVFVRDQWGAVAAAAITVSP